MIGSTQAHFHITAKLGEGGMGEVYRAEDTRLEREVALKFLHPHIAEQEDELARFEREARVLASLNHPNIGAIHSLEEVGGKRFLVLELVEGETLADRLRRGALPVSEALELARQVADALAAAHDLGIVHRDLKPANVKITRDGIVKVLDFGLARVEVSMPFAENASGETPLPAEPLTRTGTRIGTTAYMSPEQVRGHPVDLQSDIWAFGCVLYESLTAQPAFRGDTTSDTAAAILHHEPDWTRLPRETPPSIQRLLHRCLRKQPGKRLHHIADARIEVEEAAPVEPADSPPPGSRWIQRPWILAATVLLLLSLLSASWMLRSRSLSERSSGRESTRLSINLPAGQHLETGFAAALALSPDGSQLVYRGHESDRSLEPRLYTRQLSGFAVEPIPRTDDALAPFFSPDGEWLGFFAEGKLWRAPASGGPAESICETANVPTGADWGPDDTILFTTFGSGVWQVEAGGGSPRALTTPDHDAGELGHQWPQALPGGHGFLFAIVTAEGGRIVAESTRIGRRKTLLEGSNVARLLPTGHLVYVYDRGLWVGAFDLDRLEIIGSPVRVLDNVGRQFTVSDFGTLIYASAPATLTRLLWLDRSGEVTPILEPAGVYSHPQLSPDATAIALSIGHEGERDIWIHDLASERTSRLTIDGTNGYPTWHPDGQRIAFASTRGGNYDIYWKATDGTSPEETLLAREYPQFPSSWSPDGEQLLFVEYHPKSASDIWTLPVAGERPPTPILTSSVAELHPQVSPDGRWLAFSSEDSGRLEVYVQGFPQPDRRWQISVDGGSRPVWSDAGTELFFQAANGLIMAVAVQTEPDFVADKPLPVSEIQTVSSFDSAPGGSGLLVLRAEDEEGPQPTDLKVVLNWFEEVERVTSHE